MTPRFVLLCVLVLSTLLHLPARLPLLGVIRFDLIVGLAALGLCVFVRRTDMALHRSHDKVCTKRLLQLILYIVITLPLVRWPGSALNTGFETFFKAAIFYFLIVGAIHTQRQLGIFLFVFGAAQVFRVLEPLYLHLTQGYWGSTTNMGNWELMDRLSGAPSDIINPNGLGYVIVSTLPLLFFYQKGASWTIKAIVWFIAGAMLYALALTGSRSSFLVLAFLVVAWLWVSPRPFAALALVVSVGALLFVNMTELQRERYLSIVRSDVRGAGSAQGRVEGVLQDLDAALARPLFGHGLGTSLEVNSNLRGNAQPSHNLYVETMQELGLVGLFVFLRFIVAALKGGYAAALVAKTRNLGRSLTVASNSMLILMISNLVFSFASYGLSELHWYFLAGLSAVTVRLVHTEPPISSFPVPTVDRSARPSHASRQRPRVFQ
jgi:putative inorganic carbon (HCO3(-)) transporter